MAMEMGEVSDVGGIAMRVWSCDRYAAIGIFVDVLNLFLQPTSPTGRHGCEFTCQAEGLRLSRMSSFRGKIVCTAPALTNE